MGEFLTIEEVADLMRCEHRTVRRAIKGGELQAAMIGGRYIVNREAVEAWFAACCRPAAELPRRRSPRPRSTHNDVAGSVARLRAIEGGQ